MANDVKLQEGHPVDENLRPLKVGGKSTAIETAQHGNGARINGDMGVIGDLEVTGDIKGNIKDIELDLSQINSTDLTIDDAGDITLDASGGDVILKIDGATHTTFKAGGLASEILLYEKGGATTDDYFLLSVADNAATTMSTVDDAGTDADLTLSVDGDIVLDAVVDITLDAAGGDVNVLQADLTIPVDKKVIFGNTGEYITGDDTDLSIVSSNTTVLEFATQLTLSDSGTFGVISKGASSMLSISSPSGNTKIDSSADIILDADGGNISLLDDGSTYTPTAASDAVTKAYADFHYHFIRVGFDYSLTAGTKVFLPMARAEQQREGTTQFGLSEQYVFLCPFDGSLETIWARSEEVGGSTVIGLHLSSAALEVPSATATQTVTVDMAVDDTSYEFDFASAGTNTFSQGNIIMFSFDPTNDANDTHLMIVLKFDVST